MSRCRGRAGGATTIARPAPGVAGNVITAAILDALVIHGLRPGPRRFDQDRIPIQALFMGSMPGSVDPFVFGKLSIETLSRIANLPDDLLYAGEPALCLFGAGALNTAERSGGAAAVRVRSVTAPTFRCPTGP